MTADYNGWQDQPEDERESLLDTATLIGQSKISLRGDKIARSQTAPRAPYERVVPGLLLILASWCVGCTGGDAQQRVETAGPRPVPVRAAPVIDTVLARPIIATGTVAPKDEIALSFKIGGVIARVGVDPGDRVRAGQTLATLELREIDAGLSKARSAGAKAERDLARARRLYRDSVISLSELQDTETAVELARADVDATAFNRRYAVIVAPSGGTILRRAAEPGETVSPGATILVLGSDARGDVVEVGLADRDVVSVQKGDPALVSLDAFPGKSFEGRVTQIDAAADPGTGAYNVEVTLRDAPDLIAGLVGRVELRPAHVAPATLVPVEAILEADGDEATVFALSQDGTRAQRRRVTVHFLAGSSVAVSGGLRGSTAVLTDGAAYLNDGSLVEVTR